MTTPDGRYLIVRGRLWRAANPDLSEDDRTRYTAELMRARRKVGAALRKEDESAVRVARRQVHRAKVALGERGPVWWTDGAPDLNRRLVRNTPYREWYADAERWEEAILRMLDDRDPAATVCPSEVARHLEPDHWRKQMEAVREAARRLARGGAVVITQRGKRRDPDSEFCGPIRIARS